MKTDESVMLSRYRIVPSVCLFLTVTSWTAAQSVIQLKTRQVATSDTHLAHIAELTSPSGYSRGHLILQFDAPPSSADVEELRSRGINVLADIPKNALLVSLSDRVNLRGLGVHFKTSLLPNDKISPLIPRDPPVNALANDTNTASGRYLVEFHPDVDMNAARSLMLMVGAEIRENPDLQQHQLLITISPASVARTLKIISSFDEVGYIFPASQDLVNGIPVRACGGALTANGAVTQSVPTYGDGWDGPGLNAATLSYVFSRMTMQLDPTSAQTEVRRAMAEWSKAVKVSWTQGFNATATRTVNILWASGYHGDPYPFDGISGILAHTFYPAPPNSEPLAGDLHLDDAEPWRIGANTDLFSVALHELGHALGLGHSDDPSAVMYPYYRMVSQLSPADFAAIQTLYAPNTGTTTSTNSPLSLVVNATPTSTTSTTVILSGSANGGSSPIVVTWASSSGASGAASGSPSAWSIAGIPLLVGTNMIVVTATSGTSTVSQAVTITRTTSTVTGTADTTAPSLTISSPATSTVATTLSSITISGTASDNVGVTAVSWANNFGGGGTAVGTTSWSVSVPLLIGSNSITIKAFDAAGNYGWRSVIVTRQ